MTIRAIETHYAGHRFRSRIEARWAVFFDHLGITWEYEPQGYVVNGTPYLPDFLIYPNTDGAHWLELKGTMPTPDELAKARALAEGTGIPAYVYWAKPEPTQDLSDVTTEDQFCDKEGWRWHNERGWTVGSQPAGWKIGLAPTAYRFNPNGTLREARSGLWWWTDCPICHRVVLKLNGQVGWCPSFDRLSEAQLQARLDNGLYPNFAHRTQRLLNAYDAARSARFEHGETP